MCGYVPLTLGTPLGAGLPSSWELNAQKALGCRWKGQHQTPSLFKHGGIKPH